MKTAERVNRPGIENAFEVLKEVQKLEAQGKQIISFAIGEPDFDTPWSILSEACVQALRHNRTHYSPSAGIYSLRQAIADYIGRTRQISAAPENVVVIRFSLCRRIVTFRKNNPDIPGASCVPA